MMARTGLIGKALIDQDVFMFSVYLMDPKYHPDDSTLRRPIAGRLQSYLNSMLVIGDDQSTSLMFRTP